MNRLFNSITLTETQKNALFAFGEKDKVGTGANLIIAASMCEGKLTKDPDELCRHDRECRDHG